MEQHQVQPIPAGYHSLVPYLMVDDGLSALDFYQKAFDAKVMTKTMTASGEVGHCEMKIGDSLFMFSSYGEMETLTPTASSSLLIYVDNVDEFFKRAISCGAKEIYPVQDQFYGDRMGSLKDPFGHLWHIATHIEDVSPEEMQKRAEEKWGKQ